MKLSKIIKHCLNPVVLIGIAIAIIVAYKFIPSIANYSWILIVLICPLSMIFMMKTMSHNHGEAQKIFVCPECGSSHENALSAKKCASMCKENSSRSLKM
jgi:uncharacterized membrane protein YoaT (DUF817 family)